MTKLYSGPNEEEFPKDVDPDKEEITPEDVGSLEDLLSDSNELVDEDEEDDEDYEPEKDSPDEPSGDES